jgi:PQQ-like domain
MLKIYVFCFVLVIALTLAGCGSSSSTPNPGAQVTVAISPTSAPLTAGTTQQFTATVQGTSNTAVTWSVDNVGGGNSGSGTVNPLGLYTAPSQAGTHNVTATSMADTTKSASATVTVTAGAVTVLISPMSATLTAGTTQQFAATVQGTSNTAVTWSVDNVSGGNSDSGTVNASGLYTAPSQAGSHTVTATSVADTTKSASASVIVNVNTGLTVTPAEAAVAPNGTQQFTASSSATWSVDGVAGGNSSTGTITAGGLYKAPFAIGAHTITATSTANTSLTGTSSITVMNSSPGAVLTYHNDDTRQGAFTEETTLNTSNVNSGQFGKLATYAVDGQVYAQPLYLPSVSIAGGTHNVVYVATQNNSVYAFDADASSTHSANVFWHVILGPNVPKHDVEGVNPNVGILSTPVIDATTKTIYVVAEESGQNTPTPFFLYALDVTTGATKFGGRVNLTGTVTGTEGTPTSHTIQLEDFCYQRMGLALNPVTNDIEIAFGSCDHGWVLAYNKTTLQQTAVFNDTPDCMGGGLWASGGALAIDDLNGATYFMSGVDIQDDVFTNLLYNDSFIRLDTTLTILDYFTPDDNLTLAQNDADLGSGSNVLMPNNSSNAPHETIGGGKDGNVFVVNRDNMGSFGSTNSVIETVHIGTQQYNNIFSTPAYWSGSIYYHSNADGLRAFSWDSSTGMMSVGSTSANTTIYNSHGATPSVSSSGNSNGIVWDTDNSKYNQTTPSASGPLVLHAYDAADVGHELYNSGQVMPRDTAGLALKFTVPTIAGGKVFVPTGNELDIFGLL